MYCVTSNISIFDSHSLNLLTSNFSAIQSNASIEDPWIQQAMGQPINDDEAHQHI